MSKVTDLLTPDEIQEVKEMCRFWNAQKVKLSDGVWRHAPGSKMDIALKRCDEILKEDPGATATIKIVRNPDASNQKSPA